MRVPLIPFHLNKKPRLVLIMLRPKENLQETSEVARIGTGKFLIFSTLGISVANETKRSRRRREIPMTVCHRQMCETAFH